MKIKKLADWVMNDKRYQIVEKAHAIFQSEVVIREFTPLKDKRKSVEGESEE